MLFWGLIVLVLFLDQFSKYLVILYLAPWESIAILPGVLYLTHVRNPGAAFGILANWTGLFILVSLLLIGAVLLFWRRILTLSRSFQLALALEVGGAIGNLIDRLRFGQVIDFIDFRVWPVFNVADMAIVIGALLIGYNLLGIKRSLE